jgi:uncharacterized protein YndB with AHSA1/START domain
MSLAAKAQMLIRKPVAEVFEAFVNPTLTSQFWFTKGSGRLEPGAQVRWDWEMYDASAQVTVKEIVPHERIVVEWDSPGPRIEWTFTARTPDTTFVTVVNSGFVGDDAVAQALDSQGGFNLLLGGAKIYLEHGINPRFVPDHV